MAGDSYSFGSDARQIDSAYPRTLGNVPPAYGRRTPTSATSFPSSLASPPSTAPPTPTNSASGLPIYDQQAQVNRNAAQHEQFLANRAASGGLTVRQQQYKGQYGDNWQPKYASDMAQGDLRLAQQAVDFNASKARQFMGQQPASGLTGAAGSSMGAPPSLISPGARNIANIAGGYNSNVTPDSLATAATATRQAAMEPNIGIRGLNQDTNDAYARMGQLRRNSGSDPALADRIANANTGIAQSIAARQPQQFQPTAQDFIDRLASSTNTLNRIELDPSKQSAAAYPGQIIGPAVPQTQAQQDRAGLVAGAIASGLTPEQYGAQQNAQQMQQAQIRRVDQAPTNVVTPLQQSQIDRNEAAANRQAPQAKAGPRGVDTDISALDKRIAALERAPAVEDPANTKARMDRVQELENQRQQLVRQRDGTAAAQPPKSITPADSGVRNPASAPPPHDVDILRSNPSPARVQQFNRVYGQGAAESILNMPRQQ